MRVEQLGDGTPEVAIVGGIHGDEPCGVRAVERLLEERPPVERPVKLIVANERAVERGVRYVDRDLNRSFPGDPEATTHEARLAAALTEELRDCTVFALHSTRSHEEPFAIVHDFGELERAICPQLSVVAVVETAAFVEGRLLVADATVEVECGLQGSEQATENAHRLVREFLVAVGALDGETTSRELPTFRLAEVIEKPPASSYEVFVRNFERVATGETFAAVDGEPVRAERAFYPVLLSATGYREVFGYAADHVGSLS